MKKKIWYLVLIFILLQSFLDLFVTVLPSFPISLIIRGLFFILMVFYLLKEKIHLKLTIFLLFMMGVYFSYSYFSLHLGISLSLSWTFKFFYLFFVLLFFSSFQMDDKMKKTLMISMFLYITIYLLAYFFGNGNNSYLEEEGKIGYRGLFQSINEFSAILIFLYYITFSYFRKNKWVIAISTILILIVAYLTGTKVLMGGILLTLCIFLFPKFVSYFKKKSRKRKILISLSSIFLIIGGCYLFTFTHTYKNMMVQAEFFKVENIFSLDGVNRVIFNNRLTFLGENQDYFMKQDILKKGFGIGSNYEDVKLVEIDIFDILYRYGIVGFLLTVSLFLYFIKKNKWDFVSFFGLLILIFISLTSGHVLMYPAVSIYFGILFLKREGFQR